MGFIPDIAILGGYTFNKRVVGCQQTSVLKNGAVRLSDLDVGIIKWLFKHTPVKNPQITRMFKISKQCTGTIKNGKRRLIVVIATENEVDRFFKTKDYLK